MSEHREMTAEELEKWLAGVGQVIRLVQMERGVDHRLMGKAAGLDVDFERVEAHIAALTACVDSAERRIPALEMTLRLKSEEAEHFAKSWHEAVEEAGRRRDEALEEAAQRYDRMAEGFRLASERATGEKLRLEQAEVAEMWESEAREIRSLKSRPAEPMVPVAKVEAVLAMLTPLAGDDVVRAACESIGLKVLK